MGSRGGHLVSSVFVGVCAAHTLCSLPCAGLLLTTCCSLPPPLRPPPRPRRSCGHLARLLPEPHFLSLQVPRPPPQLPADVWEASWLPFLSLFIGRGLFLCARGNHTICAGRVWLPGSLRPGGPNSPNSPKFTACGALPSSFKASLPQMRQGQRLLSPLLHFRGQRKSSALFISQALGKTWPSLNATPPGSLPIYCPGSSSCCCEPHCPCNHVASATNWRSFRKHYFQR